jgi:hypothetical protein
VDNEPEAFLSARFVVFTVFVMSAAVFGGLLQSGKLSTHRTVAVAKPAIVPGVPQVAAAKPTIPTAAAHHVALPPPASAPPPKPDAFVVTTISLGQPSIAIINGVSHAEGDILNAPGAKGWRVRKIMDGAVILQNGTTLATIPGSFPSLKPLDDQLHPLN